MTQRKVHGWERDVRHRLGSVALGGCMSLAVLSGLSGCSDSGSAQATAMSTPTPSPVAIARGKIDIDGGLLEIAAMGEGQVTEMMVKPGDAIQRGQRLVQLAPQAARLDVALADAELKRAVARVQAESARVPAARDLARRLSAAAALGATDRQRADDAAATLQQIEADVTLARTDVEIQKQKRAQANHALAERTIHAPQDGRVATVTTQVGARVRAGQPVMIVVPDRPLIVRAELNESYVSRVTPGMRADVTLEAGGRQISLPARLVRIAQTYGASQLYDDTQPRTAVRVVECVLEFDQPPALRIGQTVRVNFHD